VSATYPKKRTLSSERCRPEDVLCALKDSSYTTIADEEENLDPECSHENPGSFLFPPAVSLQDCSRYSAGESSCSSYHVNSAASAYGGNQQPLSVPFPFYPWIACTLDPYFQSGVFLAGLPPGLPYPPELLPDAGYSSSALTRVEPEISTPLTQLTPSATSSRIEELPWYMCDRLFEDLCELGTPEMVSRAYGDPCPSWSVFGTAQYYEVRRRLEISQRFRVRQTSSHP
jgi:hypothetical protein